MAASAKQRNHQYRIMAHKRNKRQRVAAAIFVSISKKKRVAAKHGIARKHRAAHMARNISEHRKRGARSIKASRAKQRNGNNNNIGDMYQAYSKTRIALAPRIARIAWQYQRRNESDNGITFVVT